ncbi:MAG: hypothetical protein PHR36_05645 [Patescibacteria group bacterium]|nr:hypothetical protein [Patescibacteria group bacterium]
MTEQNLNNQPLSGSPLGLEQSVLKQISGQTKKSKRKKKEPAVILQTSGSFVLTDEVGKEIESGQAKFILDEEKFSILSESGKAISLPLSDISDFFAEEYKISLSFWGGGKVLVSEMGYQYDDFVKALTKLRHEIIQKELLMKESGKKAGFRGDYDYQKDGEKRSGEAEVEIYDTGLVIKPEQGDLIRIPFTEITDFSEKDYKISIMAGFALSLSNFGERFDSLRGALREALNELSLKTQLTLKELLPDLDPLTVQRASELLKDGQAVSKDEIDKISPKIWLNLEKKLESLNIKESYDFLKSLSKVERIFIGVKRDLMGDLTGEYIWFLVPVFSKKGGDYLAMEAASTIEGGGKATYFFKIPKGEDLDDLIKKINRCMLAINFRREPIYLSDEDLEKPNYSKYKIAISKIPELKLLRQLFCGRVVHASPENWKENVSDLINKNI